jgi:hypothetical protein
MNYSDDIMPLSNYLSLLQEYRKLTKKEQKKVVKKTNPKLSIHIPIEIQLAGSSILTLGAGFYGVYSSLNTLNVFGIVFGSVLIAIGIVILLALVSPFLNKFISETK